MYLCGRVAAAQCFLKPREKISLSHFLLGQHLFSRTLPLSPSPSRSFIIIYLRSLFAAFSPPPFLAGVLEFLLRIHWWFFLLLFFFMVNIFISSLHFI